MAAMVLLFVAGLGVWTLLEYIIHGPLSHMCRTIISPLHNVHHQDPRAVFTARAWLPLTAITLVLLALFGLRRGMFFYFGVLAGFIAYEVMHYRIHFTRPSNSFETHIRLRHLAHHGIAADSIFGVTSNFWDRVFGTEPAPARMQELEQAVGGTPVLEGSSNWKRMVTIYFAGR